MDLYTLKKIELRLSNRFILSYFIIYQISFILLLIIIELENKSRKFKYFIPNTEFRKFH